MILDEKNWLQYALNHYDNPHLSSVSEFESDLKHFSYLKSQLNKYKRTEELNLSLILNHIVIILNCFGVEGGRELLLYRFKTDHLNEIKTILYLLSVYPSVSIDSLNIEIYTRFKEI